MMEFTEDLPLTAMPAGHSSASQVKRRSSFQDEEKENQNLPQGSRISQKLDMFPLQTARVPKGIQRELPQRRSPECGAAYSSAVPTSSFYSKGKPYLNLLERKLANESPPLNPRIDGGSLPIASQTETAQPKVVTARSTTSKASKRPAASRQAKALPRNTKKAKMVLPKPAEGKEDANCAIEKKVATPFKVLSMKFKAVPKLQTGAAFFATGKKWQPGSKKMLPSPASPRSVGKPTIRERQDGHLSHSKLYLSTESKATETGRKGSPNEKKHGHVEDGVTLIHSTSQNKETACERNLLLQNTSLLQTSPSGCSETLVEKETDAGTQDSEEILQGSPKNMDKHETASSSKLSSTITKDELPTSAGDTHPFFNTLSSNKKRPQTLADEQPSPVAFSPALAILRTSKKTKELSKHLKDQMIIDAGQKHFGATICKSCGMVYSAASPEDEAQHVQYHQRFLEGIKYVSWKNEHIAAEFWDGKIVLVLQDDPKYAIKKAEAVRELVDNELGFKQVALRCPTQTYLFVSTEKKIVGCLIAEPVRQAYQVLSEPTAVSGSPTNDNLEPQRAWCCSTKPEKVFCGISRIWVFSLMRRRGIASRLVDVMRRTFLFGSFLNTNEIAFSDPTPDGKLFAAKYCQTPNFLVYNFIS